MKSGLWKIFFLIKKKNRIGEIEPSPSHNLHTIVDKDSKSYDAHLVDCFRLSNAISSCFSSLSYLKFRKGSLIDKQFF
jgi:hypothetical protein